MEVAGQERLIIEVFSKATSHDEAAESPGIGKATLWRRCRELGIN